MKIALVVNLFPLYWLAGTEIASYNIAKNLAERGHEVHVITSLDEGFPKKEMRDHFFIHRIQFRRTRLIGILSFWLNIFLEIKKIKPDIVHVQAITMAIPGLLSKVFLKKPYVIWGRGSDVYILNKSMKYISKVALKNADAVIVLTQNMKIAIMNICQRNVFVIPNGIDLERFKDIPIRMNYNDDKKTIIYVGTLRPVKGVTYLIEAMKIVKSNYHDAKLLIVGDGDDRDKLVALVKESDLDNCVSFVGLISNDEIPKYMSRSDIFVLPSLSEGFPNVILEAMASGLPVISSNVGGVPDIIQERVNGLLVEPMNPEEIADKILILLKNGDLRKEICMNNRIEVQKYSFDKVTTNLEKVYTKIINKSQ